MDDPAARGMADVAAQQVAATEVPVPDTGRALLGELEQDATYRVRRSRGTTDWLLLHTVSGAGIVRGDGETAARIGSGEAVLLRPGTLHDYGTDPSVGRWRLLYSHVHPPATWLPLLDWPEIAPGIGVIHLGAEVDARVRRSLRAAARAARLGVGRRDLFALNGIEEALLWYDTRNPRRHQLDERILAVLEHIDAHLDRDLDTTELARVAHLSPSRLSHLFTAQVGTPPARYVEAQRLELAARLLEMTPDPIVEVARRVGFRDPLYFSRRFRQAHGVSPSAHRERSRTA